MADSTITDLPVLSTPNLSDFIPYTNIATSTTCKISLNDAIKASGALPAKASNYIYVPSSNNASTNGTSLLDAYTTSKTLTPGGSALSSTNRVSIILPPGNYNLGSLSLTLDTQYIDIIGLTKEASHVTITSSNGVSTIIQTANDVRGIGYTIKNTGGTGGWKPSNNLTLAYLENIILTVNNTDTNIILSGTFKNCKATNSVNNGGGFVGSYGIASGTFIDCVGTNTGINGGGFVGYFGTASGTFNNCTGTHAAGSYGGGFVGSTGVASGTFINCTGTNTAIFGGGFVGGGTITGSSGLASGTFINCKGSNSSVNGGGFVGTRGRASGTFIDCVGTNTGTNGGGFVGFSGEVTHNFYNCKGSSSNANSGGFVGSGGVSSGTFTNCTGTNTTSVSGGFTPGLNTGCYINCRSTDITLPVLSDQYTARGEQPACYVNCFDGSGNLVNGSAQYKLFLPGVLIKRSYFNSPEWSESSDVYLQADVLLNSNAYNNNTIIGADSSVSYIVNEFQFGITGLDGAGRGLPVGSLFLYNGERNVSLSVYYTTVGVVPTGTWTTVIAERKSGIWTMSIGGINQTVGRITDAAPTGIPSNQLGNTNLKLGVGLTELTSGFNGSIATLIAY